MDNVAEAHNRSAGIVSERAWIREAHTVVEDLFERRPGLYWLDLLVSATVAWCATIVFFGAGASLPLQIIAMLIAGVAFYRAGTFMHEIIHMGRSEMVGFKRTWNALVGIPLLMPWILYRNHIEHHSRAHFGTPRDGEYLPLAASPIFETIKYLAKVVLLPLMALGRFGVVAPLSYLIPGLRRWLLAHGSAYVSNPYYAKPFPSREGRHLLIVELLCLAWIGFWVGMTIAGPVEPVHWLMAWALHGWTLALNWVRNLAAHSYDNNGEPLTHLGQLEDAVNITGQTWLTTWLFPVGLRYHALHHLFPGLPYHAMGRAHRRLLAHFGPDSPYAAVNHDSYFQVVGRLLRRALATPRTSSAIPTWQAQR